MKDIEGISTMPSKMQAESTASCMRSLSPKLPTKCIRVSAEKKISALHGWDMGVRAQTVTKCE